jgi:2-polyprenyl-3-methyl-5-hydroxy-6-metoxy-1,4-benzoquinol methylase
MNSTGSGYEYQGQELRLFQNAAKWKGYYARELAPHISGAVLEVGAGIGGTARFLCTKQTSSWTALEPDEALTQQLREGFRDRPLPIPTEIVCGTTATLEHPPFDTLLYIDVLEHIEDDRGELVVAARLLKPGGRLIVLCPAHNMLFSPFDQAVGHFRRYTRSTLVAVAPADMTLVRAFYLDSVGMLMSLANRLVLRSRYPTEAQIAFWNKAIVPMSVVVDPLTGYRLGKTIICVWTKRGAA